MKLEDSILKIIKKGVNHRDFSGLISHLSKEFNVSVDVIAKTINKLIKSGQLIEEKNNRLSVSKTPKLLEGIICGTSKSYAFIKCEGRDDLFVPAPKLKGALDGDKIEFIIVKGDEAEVIRITNRANNEIVGTLSEYNEQFFVIPNNTKISKKISIPKRDLNNAQTGDKVVAEIVYQSSGKDNPIGKILSVFKGNEHEIAEQMMCFKYQLSEIFSNEVNEECSKIETNIPSDERKRRKDLTNEIIFTIDGADAKDLDDAVSVKRTENGYILGVHIADVGHYVKYKSKLDEEAYIRGTSVYFPTIVFPMLPKILSNNLCSLNPNEEKLALSVIMDIDNKGIVKKHEIFESVIKSINRLTYTEVYDVICGKKVEKCENIKEDIMIMAELAKILEENRKIKGALDLDLPETYFELNENYEITAIKERERNSAHKLIESFMIICNEVIAKHCCIKKMPFVYRVHEKPTKEKIAEVSDQLSSLGVNTLKIPKDVDPLFVQDLLEKVKNKDYAETANKLILRALQKARYSEECLGHFGLALEYYCHFTSPIRRYPDLVIHRIIKNNLNNQLNNSFVDELKEYVIEASERSSLREKNADEAEREYDDYLKAKYMLKHIGEIFAGRISGLTEFGIFVSLDNTIEGMVKVELLPDEEFKYDGRKLILKGRNRAFKLGQEVKIRVANVDMQQFKIEFELI